MARARGILAVGVLALGLLGLPGCQTGPEPSVRSTVDGSLESADVGDVAVAAPTSGGALAGPLRDALYAGLIERRYSVLDPDFVDGGGRGGALLLTSIAAGPEVTGARTALYESGGALLYEASVAAPTDRADAALLAELLLRDLPGR